MKINYASMAAAFAVDEFRHDLDVVLRKTGGTLMLGWGGKWLEVGVAFPGDAAPRIFLKWCRKWGETREVPSDDPRLRDFVTRFADVMRLHGMIAQLGVEAGVGKLQLVPCASPRYAGRFLYTTPGKSAVYVRQDQREAVVNPAARP